MCMITDSMPTAVSVRTVVTEEWMDRFVMDPVECPSVSRISAVGRPCLRSIPLVFFAGGGEVADTYPLVVAKSDTARVSALPVAGCKFLAVFLGKVAFDVAGLGVGPPCLRVDSEETLLTVTDKRAQLAHAAPGVTPVDSSEEEAPVRELIQLSVLGEPLVNSLQESMAAEERLEYSIQATAIVWQPLEQMRCVVSDDVNSYYFGMASWDAGGMHGNDCECRETFWTMMLQWLIWLLCRPVIRNGLGRATRMIMEYGLDQFMMTNMDSPQLAVAPGEWHASDTLMPLSHDLHQMYGIPEVMGVIYDCRTTWDFHRFDFTAADHSAVELDELTFRRRSFLPDELSARGDTCDVVMLDDLILRHMSFPPDELSAGRDGIYMTDCDTVWCSPHMNSTVADCGALL